MKWLIRIFCITLLFIAAFLIIARREASDWIVYQSNQNGVHGIYLMAGDGGSARKITPDDLCSINPSWSPPGQKISFLNYCVADETQRAGIHITSPSGGHPQLLSLPFDVRDPSAISWSPDGRQLLLPHGTHGSSIVNIDDGSEKALAVDYFVEQWSPDSEWIYGQERLGGQVRLDRVHVRTGRTEQILRDDITSDLSWSPDEAQIVSGSKDAQGLTLLLIAPDDSRLGSIPLNVDGQRIVSPRWSPDGEWIAFVVQETLTDRHIYRIRSDASSLERLTEQPSEVGTLQWSPDGGWLLFAALTDGSWKIHRLRSDGSELHTLTHEPGNSLSPQYAPASGLDWRPAGLVVVVLVLFFVSLLWEDAKSTLAHRLKLRGPQAVAPTTAIWPGQRPAK